MTPIAAVKKLKDSLKNYGANFATGQGELLLAMNAKQRSSVRWQKQSKQGGELLGLFRRLRLSSWPSS